MAEIFDVPFADKGDKESIPNANPTDNSVSWEQGFSEAYSKTPTEGGKVVTRGVINQIFYLISHEIIQRFKDIAARFTTTDLEATNATLNKVTTSGATSTATLEIKTSGTIATPSTTAQGNEIVNAAWARNFLSSGNGDVGAGYKIYTAVIDLMSAQKNVGSWDTSYVYFMDDAASLTAYSQEAERMALFGIYPCLFVNGAESTKLNPSNFAQNTSGASVDITTLGNDVMIKFPRMGLRIRQKGSLLYIQFTDDPNAKDFSYAAFQRERTANQGMPVTKNAFYWGAYKAYLANSKMYSSSGKTATAGQALSTFRAQAQARGDGYAAASWFQWVYIQAVCIFVKASINSFYSRPGFGYTQNTTMPATGTANAYGMRNENLTAAQLSGRAHQAKFLGIEDIWGAQPEWRDGIIVRAYQLMVTQGITACNNDGAGYSELGMFYNGTVDAFTASFAGNDFAGFYPASTKSTWDGVPNGVKGGRFIQGNGTFGVGVGGVWNSGYYPYGTGLFALNANIATTTAGGGYTSRLMYI